MNNEYGNPTLPEIADYIFHLLGSWWEDNGIETKIRKDYTNSEPKNGFNKYNLKDRKSEISKGISKFATLIFADYRAFSLESLIMLMFPNILVDSIVQVFCDERFWHPKKINIQILVSYYIGSYFVGLANKDKGVEILHELCTESYRTILNAYKRFNLQNITEKSKWSTIKTFLDAVWQREESEEEKKEISVKIIRHYLFLNTKIALSEVFGLKNYEIAKLFENTEKYIIVIHNNYIRLEGKPYPSTDIAQQKNLFCCIQPRYTKFDWHYRNDFGNENFFRFSRGDRTALSQDDVLHMLKYGMNYWIMPNRAKLIDEAHEYFVNSYTKLSDLRTNNFLRLFKSYDESFSFFFMGWYRARAIVFSIDFEDEERYQKDSISALTLFRETFDKYKYFVGINLREFLSDAIAADVYFNRKPLKEIINNNQDDTDEASIKKPGKTYWEFAYATEIFDEDSKKTYLTSYNAEENFWTNFPASKFIHQEAALKRYEREIVDEELRLPILIKDFNDSVKIDNLLSKTAKASRQSLGIRLYSNLSIAIMHAETDFDFQCIENFIKTQPIEKLCVNDECGASPLARALNEYKNCVYGFDSEYRQKRAEILANIQKTIRLNYKELAKEKYSNLSYYDRKILKLSRKNFLKSQNLLINAMGKLYNSYSKNLDEKHNSLSTKVNLLKEKVIKPLIEKSDKHILDEAIHLDSRYCVNALQLAIDSYDDELVKLIVEHLPSNQNDLSKLYISEEYTTALQYAIRKYDRLMQFAGDLAHGKFLLPLEYNEIQNRKIVTRGVLPDDKEFYKTQNLYTLLKEFSFEECGAGLLTIQHHDNVYFAQQEHLINIIKYLAEKTNPISVDTMYYLTDQIDKDFPSFDGSSFDDVMDIARSLLDTDHVEVAQANVEWNRGHNPNTTLLARCIEKKNWAMVKLILSHPNSLKRIKPTINRIVSQWNEDRTKIVKSTDADWFFAQMYSILPPKKYKSKAKFKSRYEWWAKTTHDILLLFKNAGARFDIPDNLGKTTLQYIVERKEELPEGSIPEEIL